MINSRYEFIDSMRGIAILGVILTHVGAKTLEGSQGVASILHKFTSLGDMGVPLFYFVSALTIMLMFTKRRGEEVAPVGSFFIRRFLRIAPVYWAGIIMYTSIYGLTESRGWLDGPELWHYPVHIFFLNMTNPYTPSSVVPGGWSISNEMIFYALFPMLYFLANTPKKALILLASSVLISPLFEVLARWIANEIFPSASRYQVDLFAYRWLPNQISAFAAGFVFYHIFKSTKRHPSWLASRTCAAATLLFAPALIILTRNEVFQDNHIWAVWFIAFAFIISINCPKIVVNKALSWVGKISFSCYIFHFMVINYMLALIPPSGSLASFCMVLAGTLAGTFCLSWLSYNFYEKKFMTLTTKVVEAYQTRMIRRARVGGIAGSN